jgi:tetratricopeptide (TPR) repeat protein
MAIEEQETMDKAETIIQAKKLRKADELEESQELLLQLLEEYPEDPEVLFEVGGSFDVLGMESKAVPYYEEAIEHGLDGEELQECLVCLGISHRIIGEFPEAIDALEKAVEQFPDDNSGRAFLALAYYSDERYEEAVRLLLSLLLETTNDEQILGYADPLDFYKDNLDEVWDD